MEYHVRVNVIGGAIVLALGVAVSAVTSTYVAGKAYKARGEQVAKREQDMTVKGSARTRVRSDLAVWRISVSGEAAELALAFGLLEGSVNEVQAFLAQRGFKPEEIGLEAISTYTHYERDREGNQTRKIEGYTLHRTFTVTSADVDRVAAAAGEVTGLIRDGILVSSMPPEYYFTKIADLKVSILGEASKDARARAEEIATNSGCRVGDVRRAQMGVLQITQPNSTEVSSMGIYDTRTIDKDVSAVVTLTFGVSGRAGG